ncbi:hypothetical protein Ddc_10151 [Ditylenchus destructor]|nr:hypothetical protein Ddc_10151 [Ditylenchus destructor]
MQKESKKKEFTLKEKVKLVLQSRVEGYENIGHLLSDLQTEFGIDGNDLAISFGIRGARPFDLFLRSEQMRDICQVEDRTGGVTIYRAAYDRRVQHIFMEMMVSKREGEKKAQLEEERKARQMAYNLAEPCGSYRRARQNQRPVDRGLQSNLQSTETVYKRDARKLNTPTNVIGGNDRPNSSSESNNHCEPAQVSKESRPSPSIQSIKDDRSRRVAPNEPDENRYRRNIGIGYRHQTQNGQSRPNPSVQSFNVDRLQSVAQNMMDENRYRKGIQTQNGSSSKSNNHFEPAQVSKELQQNPSIRSFKDDRSQRIAPNEPDENRFLRNIQMQNGSRRPPTPGGNIRESDEDGIDDWDYEVPKRTMKKPPPKSNHIRPNDQYHFSPTQDQERVFPARNSNRQSIPIPPTQVSNESRQNPSFQSFKEDRSKRIAQKEPDENRYRRNTQMQNGSRRPPTPHRNAEETDEDEINDWDYEVPKRPMKKPTTKSNHIRPNDQYHFAPIQDHQPNPSFQVSNDNRSQRIAQNELGENRYHRNIQDQERVFPARNSNRQSIPIPPRARTEHPISFFARFGKDLLPKPDDGLKSRQTCR